MGFETYYKSFIEAIVLNEIKKVEEIITASDNRAVFINKAINDLGKTRVEMTVSAFRSVGLKKSLEKCFNEVQSFKKEKVYTSAKENRTFKYIHYSNKAKNEKSHLSGSSFPNENKLSMSA